MSTTANSVQRPWWTSKYARIGAVMLVIGAIIALFVLFPVADYIEDFVHWVHGFNEWAGVVFGAAYVVATIAFVPGTPITLAAGFAFGLLWGVVIVHAASTVSAALSFIIGRFIAREWVAERVEEHRRFDAACCTTTGTAATCCVSTRRVPRSPA
jgi:uncharacterized membrane protein YdjX (TVP38/TMEM64 family)